MQFKTITQKPAIRKFIKDKSIPTSLIDLIIKTCQNSPSSFNLQEVVIIRITDVSLKKAIFEITKTQTQILDASEFWIFCLDYYKINSILKKHNKTACIEDMPELLSTGSLDVGIAMSAAIMTAEENGLATNAIGYIHADIAKVTELLKLPTGVVPLCGLVLGYSDDSSTTKHPRLAKKTYFMENQYDQQTESEINSYLIEIAADWPDWTKILQGFLGSKRNSAFAPTLIKQGYLSK